MKRSRNGVIRLTEDEYKRYPEDIKGIIDAEWSDRGIVSSFVWNRTLKLHKQLYIEGFNMVIE